MRRFSLIMAVVAVMILCLGISSTAIAQLVDEPGPDVIRIDLVDTAGGTAAGHAVLIPTRVATDNLCCDMQIVIVGHGLAEGTSYDVGIGGVVSRPLGNQFFLLTILSSTTNAAGVLALQDSKILQGPIVSVEVVVVSDTSSDPALFGSGP